jgi:hypothetical protein
MEGGKIIILAQLINTLRENYAVLKSSYNESNKEKFEQVKKIILELQSKIEFLLKEENVN